MTNKDIKRMLEDSKKVVDVQQDSFTETVSEDLATFKKKALDRIH